MVFDKYIKLCSIDQKDIRFIKNASPDKWRPFLGQFDDDFYSDLQITWACLLPLTSKIDGNWVSLIPIGVIPGQKFNLELTVNPQIQGEIDGMGKILSKSWNILENAPKRWL